MTGFVALLYLAGQLPATEPTLPPHQPAIAGAECVLPCAPGGACPACLWVEDCCQQRHCLESDHAFDNFIGPLTNPVFSKDPRSLTEARFLFVQNHIPSANPVMQGGDFQLYAMQVRVALTERLSFIADKDGYAVIKPGNRDFQGDGWVDLAAGLKYVLLRDVENQRLLTAGIMYEIPSGEDEVFQSHGSGLFTVFGTGGAQLADYYHLLTTVGYVFPVNSNANSSFYYASLHLDRQVWDWIYPLIELNWFHWVASGDRGLPGALGEGDGLLNLGTSDVAGNDLVTFAVGLKFKPNPHIETGAAWEFPLSNREDLLGNRVTAEFIFRY